MQTAKRPIDPSVIDRLTAEPYRFEFFQAVRVLALQLARERRGSVDHVVGGALRFRSSISLVFPASEIEQLHRETSADGAEQNVARPETARSYTLTPSLIGLTGPMGVLPTHYTQRLAERELYFRDRAARAFLDQFANRAITLFYKAWTKYRLHLQFERDRRERFLPLLLSLAGLAPRSTRERLAHGKGRVFDETLAYYAAAVRQRPQSADVLARVLCDHFKVPVNITQFVGRWFAIPDDQTSVLGGELTQIGVNAFCGARVWQRQTRIRLVIGPLNQAQFGDFLPRGAAAEALAKMLTMLAGVTFEYEVQLVLEKSEVKAARLGVGFFPSRLGWDAFMHTRAPTRDADEARYEIMLGHS